MPGPRNINLAWAILSHRKGRLAVSVAGIGFAILLMFMEIGFLNGLLDSETLLAEKLDADLIIINKKKAYAYALEPFPRERLVRARAVAGVERVTGLYMQWMTLKNLKDKKIHGIVVLAYDTASPALLIPEINARTRELKYTDTALFDRTSRREVYGLLTPGESLEIENRRFRIISDFALYPNFSTDGHVVMDRDNLARAWGDTGEADILDSPEFGLVRLFPDADLLKVKAALADRLAKDMQVMTKAEMVTRIKDKWKQDQPVVAIFGLGLLVGFAIGMIICYQILFTDISDHAAEFATLKAMGYTNGFLIRTVMAQGVYLALVSFGPGLLASFVFYNLLQQLTGIWMTVTVPRALAIFILTLAMCVVSAFFAARKVIRMDPAEVF